MRCERLLLLVLLFAAATQTRAQEVLCLDTDTPRQCVVRLQAAGEAVVQAAVATTNAGTDSVSSPARSALKDFLSVASAHLDGAVLEDRGQSLALAYNLPLVRPQVKVETVFTTPQVSNAATAAAGSAPGTLVSTFSNADDVRSSVSLQPATRRFGRSIAPHRERFASIVMNDDISGIARTRFDEPFATIVPDATERASAIAAFETAVKTALVESGTAFASLLANQPQLYATGAVHHRKPAIGPRVWQAIVTWEMQTHNLNGFYASGRPLRDYAAARPRYPGRLALSVAYNRVLSSTVDVPNPYVTPAAAGFVYTAAYGLPFASFLSDREGRLDFTMTYDGSKVRRNVLTTSAASRVSANLEHEELRSLDPPRDRVTLAMTYTQKLSERVTVPLSLVWSDRSESLPGACVTVEERTFCEPPMVVKSRPLAVHVGVKYTIPPRAPERPRCASCCC